MDSIFESLSRLGSGPLGAVLHIGAGNGSVLDRYAPLRPTRVVLFEGDPEAASELQRGAAGLPWVEVHAQPVAAAPGLMAWHRYNLPALNGPLDAGRLAAYYPRMRNIESRKLQAVSMAAAVGSVASADGMPAADGALARVLVLDLPGQEDALLAALPDQLLFGFDAVILRGCRAGAEMGGAAATAAVEQLRRRCFAVMAGDGEPEPLWPVTCLRFDAERYRTGQLQQRLTGLQDALQEQEQAQKASEQARAVLESTVGAQQLQAQALQARIDAMLQKQLSAETTTAEQAEQICRLTQALAEQSRLAGEREAAMTELMRARSESEGRVAELQARLEAALGDASAAATDSAARIEAIVLERDEQTRLAEVRLEQTQAVGHAKAEFERIAYERYLQIEELNKAAAAAAELAGRHAARIAELNQALGEQVRLVGEREAGIRALIAERDELAQRHDAAVAQCRNLERAIGEGLERERLASDQRQRLSEDLAGARQSTALAVKLQTLREADLQDLRTRYQATLVEQQAQHDLLAKLAQRLTAANQYFQQLSQSQQSAASIGSARPGTARRVAATRKVPAEAVVPADAPPSKVAAKAGKTSPKRRRTETP